MDKETSVPTKYSYKTPSISLEKKENLSKESNHPHEEEL